MMPTESMTDVDTTPGDEHHGTSMPTGLAEPGRGRFGRMFPFLPVTWLDDSALEALASAMPTIPVGHLDNESIPAGFTYLGQFIDHDLTYDPTSQLQRLNDPLALADFRSPRLDLDCLYGSGPADQPFLYDCGDGETGVRLLEGGEGAGPPPAGSAIRDLPRNQQGRALIGDPRNDENAIVAQLHLLFVRFHNGVVKHVGRRGLEGIELFREAQRIVRWHYQWIVAHDFLPRVVGREMAASIFRPDSRQPVRRKFYAWEREPFIPVEFSGAAYRFGHSMVRDDYTMNSDHPTPVPIFDLGAQGPETDNALHGFRRLRAAHTIDWALFFDLPSLTCAQPSHRIDTNIAAGLSALPHAAAAEPSLTRLNLLRGRALGLPSGADVARAMGHAPLSAGALGLDKVESEEARLALERSPPLWHYVLCEAMTHNDGTHLGPVGGRIVGEVVLGLLEADPASYLNQSPTWTPELGSGDGFTMADLVGFVGRMEQPSPPPAVTDNI
jgi:hypothetical protein